MQGGGSAAKEGACARLQHAPGRSASVSVLTSSARRAAAHFSSHTAPLAADGREPYHGCEAAAIPTLACLCIALLPRASTRADLAPLQATAAPELEALSRPSPLTASPRRQSIMQAAVKAQAPAAAARPAARRPRSVAAAATGRPGLRAAAPERRALHDAPARQLAARAAPSSTAEVQQAAAQQVGRGRAGRRHASALRAPLQRHHPRRKSNAAPTCAHPAPPRLPAPLARTQLPTSRHCCSPPQPPAPPAETKYASNLEVLPLNPKCDTIRVSCSERLSEVEFK